MAELHEDLVAIRNQLNLTTDDIYDRTRIAKENIELIENGTLFESGQNKTYVRSFARTYARAIGVNDDDIVQALDELDSGKYDGSLAQKYLEVYTESRDSSDTDSSSADEDKPETGEGTQKSAGETGTAKTGEADKESIPPKKEASSKTPKAAPSPGKYSFQLDDSKKTKKIQKPPSTLTKKESDTKASKATPAPRVLDPKDKKAVDWSQMSKKAQASRKKGSPVAAIILTVFLILAVIAAIYFYLNFFAANGNGTGTGQEMDIPPVESPVVPDERMTEPDPGAEAGSTVSDTLDAPVAPNPDVAEAVVGADTLHVKVYAVNGNLEPFRVMSDAFAGRRPYWIEEGIAMRIEFIDEVTIFAPPNRMLVLYNDRVITDFAERNPDENSVTINRDQFEADSTLESFTNSELPAGVNPPREIIDRPIILN